MGTITGTLKHGLTVGGVVQNGYELREPLTADMLAAEDDAPIDKPLAYDMALLCQVLLRVGDFTGPFTPELLGRLKPVDFRELRQALIKAYALGESEPAEAATG